MAHHGRYDSTLTKKSIEKKERAKSKSCKNRMVGNELGFIISESNCNFGVVIETRYNDATILYEGKLITAHLKIGVNAVCNQVVYPGDRVIVEQEKAEQYSITHLLKRKNILARTKRDSTRNSTESASNHNIAANIDVAVIVVSAKTPPLHPKFIDRYLMILQNNGIDCIICLNKSDLKTENDEKILDLYRQIKIPVIETCTLKNSGIAELKERIRGKQAIFVGHSGVGKSSLTNAIMNTNEIKTSHTSLKSGKGRHTTTTSKYYIWDEESSVIDTPGIRSLDVSNFAPDEIQHYFPEFDDWSGRCKYGNCIHYREPQEGCMVKQAVKSGIINSKRYESYIRILKDITNEKDKIKKIEDSER